MGELNGIQQYEMVRGGTTEELSREVTARLRGGWSLHGTAFPVVTATRENGINVYFVQPMVARCGAVTAAPPSAVSTPPQKGLSLTDDRRVLDMDDVITFGKHSGSTIRDLLKHNHRYLVWVRDNVTTIRLDSSVLAVLDDADHCIRDADSNWASPDDDIPF